jgi:hypothetical protein
MIETEGQTIVRTDDEWELMDRGKGLLTVEQWEKFAFCPNCYKQKCSACVSGPSGLTEVEQIKRFYIPMEIGDSEVEYIPSKLWDIEIQCCSCGSRQHIVDWLEEAIQPEIYYVPEVEEAMLRAAKEEQEGSLH